MSAHAEPAGHGHEHHHGPPIANKSSKVDATVLGMFLFIGSEAMLFGSMFKTDDMREGTRAFLEKRHADFKGK